MRGTIHLMKSATKKIILNEIRLAEGISRANIAKKTGLTPPTVTNIVKELITDQLVEESHLGKSSGGRKPTILQLKADGYYVIAVDAGTRTVEVALCDMVGKIVIRKKNKIHTSITGDKLMVEIIELIQYLLEKRAVDENKIIGIGVAMHGVMDIEKGESLFSSNTGLRRIPIKKILEEKFSLPTILENNSRALALGEFWFGQHRKTNRFCAINIGRGVGSGLIVNNQLIHGAQYVAGELGHATISFDGERCSCGQRGCLEMFISGEAIARRAKRELKDASDDITAEEVYKLAKTGNEDCIKILEETGYYMSIGILNLINTVNPTTIVLGGGVMKSEEFLMPIIHKQIKEKGLTNKIAQETKLYVGEFKDNATLLGAGALWFNKLFYS